MNTRKFIIGGLAFASVSAGCCAFRLARLYKEAKAFEKDLDRGDDSLDDMVLFSCKKKNGKDQPMKDLKLGVFYGAMEADLSQVVADEKDYRMDLNVRTGGLNVIVPDNFKLNLVDRCRFGGIANHTVSPTSKDAVSLSVRADVKFGALNFENPKH